MKLTEWYGRNVQPARPGVYQRLYVGGDVFFCLFDGLFWHDGFSNPGLANEATWRDRSHDQFKPWRGLSRAPK